MPRAPQSSSTSRFGVWHAFNHFAVRVIVENFKVQWI